MMPSAASLACTLPLALLVSDRIYCGGLLFRKRCLFSLYNLHDLPERSWGLEKLGVCPPPMFWALKLYPP